MIWNLLLHSVMGYLGKDMFTFSTKGFIWLIAITMLVQGIDMFRFYKKQKNLVYKTIDEKARQDKLEHMKTNAHKYKIIQFYLMKVIFYGSVTLFVAYLFR
ncbi:MAG: hypothetical protein WC599_12740 [Bacteroidales bacterium]